MPDKVPRLSEVKKPNAKKLAKVDIDRMVNRLTKTIEQKVRGEDVDQYVPKKEKIGTCSCKGDIVLLTTYTSEYNPMSGPMIIGPGSRGQFNWIKHQECFCESCGGCYKAEIVKKMGGS